MSYCVQCGVKLSDYHEKCPLCGTEVINPNKPTLRANTDYPDYHVVNDTEKKTVKHYVTGIILSLQVVVYSLVVFFLDWVTGDGINWSLIPILSLGLIWITVAYPFFRKKNSFFRLFTYDSIALIAYILLLNFVISQNLAWAKYAAVSILFVWIIIAGIFLTDKIRKVLPITIYYIIAAVVMTLISLSFVGPKGLILQLGLPIIISFIVVSLICYFVIKASSGSILSIGTVLLVGVTVLCVIIDMTLIYNTANQISVSWSLIVAVVMLPAAATMFGIKKSNEIYAIISRKLHR